MLREDFPRTGFTLIELIVSMTILGLIVSVLYGSLSVGLRSVDSSRRKGDTFQRIRISRELISRELTSSYLKPSSSDWTVFLGDEFFGRPGGRTPGVEEEKRIAFRGEDAIRQGKPFDSLTFNNFTRYPDGSRILSLVWIGLSQDDAGDNLDLLMTRRPLYGPWKADTTQLAVGLEGMDISYLHTDENDESMWQDEWDSESELPEAIEITMSWIEEDGSALQVSRLPLLLYLPERPVK